MHIAWKKIQKLHAVFEDFVFSKKSHEKCVCGGNFIEKDVPALLSCWFSLTLCFSK